MNPVTSAGRTSVDIGASANLDLVDKFCYLGDMLSVDGDGFGFPKVQWLRLRGEEMKWTICKIFMSNFLRI